MNLIEMQSQMGHEQVVFCYDKYTGLKAIIAVHDTTLGPALGGCRFWDYAHEDDALFDVLRLSRGMTYKASVAGLRLGGGKSVIIGDPKKLKSEKFFRAFGRFVNSLGGSYITAEDVNVKVEDIANTAKETKYVSGLTKEGGSGDPSPFTALGVYKGILAAAKFQFNKDSVEGLKIAVQGTGAVGSNLCKYLSNGGAKLYICDVNQESAAAVAKECKAELVACDKIFSQDVDIFAPCALGAILNPQTIPVLKAKIVAGAANNQLLDEKRDGLALKARGILFAPDYVINAGGLINVTSELEGYNQAKVEKAVGDIYNTLIQIFEKSQSEGILTREASDLMAEERIAREREKIGAMPLQKTFNNQSWIKV